jgi:hypothetical protein
MVVVAPAPDFTLAAEPVTRTVAGTAVGKFTVMVTPIGGFAGTVSFKTNTLPNGAKASFSPSVLAVAGGTAATTLSIRTNGRRYTYAVTVTATSGSLRRTTKVTLVVR